MLRAFTIIRRVPIRCRTITTAANVLKIEESVQDALANGKPVVALESTIVAHGMPYPQNLELAQAVEAILRAKVRTVPAVLVALRDSENLLF
jgi:pseudouridine-5'-phosphate glycosidase